MERVIPIANEADRTATIKAHRRRLAILELLETQPGHRANGGVVGDCLHELALSGAGPEIRACFEFLEKSGLVRNELVGDVLVSTLTPAGLDFLEGRTIVDGVTRPRPK